MSTTPGTDGGLRVGELAAQTGVTADTLRYYERVGLLAPPARTDSGYRTYRPEVRERLHFIRGCQRLGLRLAEIRDLLNIRDTGECPCEPAERLLHTRVDEIEAELARLTALRDEMAAMAERLAQARCPSELGPTTWCPPD